MLDHVSWIASNKASEGSFYFRKSFELPQAPKTAMLFICALGLGVCKINGQAITDEVYSTPFTRYDARVLYQTYDVTQFLTQGKNAMGVHVGNGMYNNTMKTWNDLAQTWRGKPKLAAKLVVTLEDGSEFILETDKTWKSTNGAYTYNMARIGAIYDARLKKEGWDRTDYDDRDWDFCRKTPEPGGILEPMAFPPCRVCKVYPPIAHRNGVYDFGVSMSGRARIRMKGTPGQEVILQYAERIFENGEIDVQGNNLYHNLEQSPLHHEEKILCSGEMDEYASDFVYYGFRYVKVENAPDNFEIQAEFIHTDLQEVGTFVCDDEMLQKIHQASVQATLSNYMGLPTDCPHREQNGWTGDASLSAEQALMNFDMVDAYKKWLRDIKDTQRPSGQISGIAPTSNWGYNEGSGPAWDSAFLLLPWYIYRNTGDTSIIEELWDRFELYMNYFERMTDNGIAQFGLGDWCPLDWENMCPNSVTDTAYFYADCIVMSKMATAIGKDSRRWEIWAEQAKKAWRDTFLSDESLKQFKTFYACAIFQGLLEPEEVPVFAKKLADLVIADDYHIDCGILGTKYIFTALAENGYNEVLYKAVTNPTMPSYAYWIHQGATALCERWNMEYSNNHHMFSEVDHWFYKYIGGIRLEEGGRLVIAPTPLDAVRSFKVTHKGISVERKEDTLFVTVPCDALFQWQGTVRELKKGTHQISL